MAKASHQPANPRNRTSLERMLHIHQAVQQGTFPNTSTLSRSLEVSNKTVQRDLTFMRDRLCLPLAFDPQKNGYAYTEEVSSFPSLQISEGELFALLVAEKALQQYRGTHFEKPLLSAFRKLAHSLPDTITVQWADWDASISFRTRAEPVLNLQLFDSLAQATARHQRITILYRKPGQSQAESRTIDPYHLANINGEWFLFAYCHLRNDIRTFVPSRIKSIQVEPIHFKPKKKFSLDQRLKSSFGVVSGKGDYTVIVEFSDLVADYIREKKWHPTQQLEELPDGILRMTLRLSTLIEIQRWLLGWGSQAKVISPPELIHAITQSAKDLLNHYH